AVQKFAYGELYRQAGDYGRALIEYEEAAAIDSTSPIIYERIGEIYFALNSMSRARDAFMKTVALNPDNPELYDMIALTYIIDRKAEEAEKIWKYLIETYPEYEDAWYNLSDYYFAQNDTTKGLEILEKFYHKNPENADVLARIADVLHQSGRYESSIPYLVKLIELVPDNHQFYQRLFTSYLAVGNVEEAYKTLQHWRNQVGVTPQTELLYADMLIRNEAWDQALDILYRGHSLWPDQWTFPHLIAIAYIQKEEPDSVRKYYNLALSKGTPLPIAYQNYAFWLADHGDIQTAMDVVLEGRDLYPQNEDLMYLEALFLDELDESLKAITLLENLRTLQPENEEVLKMLAALYDKTGQPARAEALYQQLLDKNEEDPLVLNNYSYLLAVQNKEIYRAWMMIQKALSMEPNNAAYLDTAAWVLYCLGRYSEALDYINRALLILPYDHEILYHKAMILLSMDQKDSAIEYLQKSLENKPDYKPAFLQLEAINHD
ncbi:MAG: tetratricopeptide repeat protein, partial [Candidatus Marinimicrobia bacterium]|nr:tetratricopeptide repeat protein [Candidatus Neomarinimicrobiota bacterium]